MKIPSLKIYAIAYLIFLYAPIVLLPIFAGLAVRAGMAEEDALKAITIKIKSNAKPSVRTDRQTQQQRTTRR